MKNLKLFIDVVAAPAEPTMSLKYLQCQYYPHSQIHLQNSS